MFYSHIEGRNHFPAHKHELILQMHFERITFPRPSTFDKQLSEKSFEKTMET